MSDNRYSKFGQSLPTYNSSTVAAVVSNVNGISAPNAVLGYTMWDEPTPGVELNTINSWVAEFNRIDPNRICYVNLLPFCNCSGIYGNIESDAWIQYGKYVDSYLKPKKSTVVSFDYYPFISSSTVWGNYGWSSTYYFRSLNLYSTKTKANGVVFWSIPYCSNEFGAGAIPVTLENLRFLAFAPIVYGAKGLMYYNYPLNNAAQGTAIYNWAKSINQQIETLGPLLMRLVWQGTYHENATDLGYTGCSSEPSLTTVPSTDPIIKKFSSTDAIHSFMVGSFQAGSTPYLLVFNKDRNASHSVTLTFKKSLPVWECNKSTGIWSRLSASTTSITLNSVGISDMRVIRLANPDMTPVNSLLLND